MFLLNFALGLSSTKTKIKQRVISDSCLPYPVSFAENSSIQPETIMSPLENRLTYTGKKKFVPFGPLIFIAETYKFISLLET